MFISRRDFVLAGSTSSALFLAGCGGGGSADGAPKATAAVSKSCATLSNEIQVVFSNAVSFPNADLPLILDSDAFGSARLGCSNQYVDGSEGFLQEIFVSFIQIISAAQSCTKGYVRTLRLHMSIPQDTSGTQIDVGDVFYFGNPDNPGSSKVFSGDVILTDPTAVDGQNSWAYQIIGGSLTVLNGFNGFFLPLQLSNVVAKAATAGSANNAAYSSGGQVEMNGDLVLLMEPLFSVLNT